MKTIDPDTEAAAWAEFEAALDAYAKWYEAELRRVCRRRRRGSSPVV